MIWVSVRQGYRSWTTAIHSLWGLPLKIVWTFQLMQTVITQTGWKEHRKLGLSHLRSAGGLDLGSSNSEKNALRSRAFAGVAMGILESCMHTHTNTHPLTKCSERTHLHTFQALLIDSSPMSPPPTHTLAHRQADGQANHNLPAHEMH